MYAHCNQRLYNRCAIAVQVLRLLIKLYERAAEPDWVSICQCLMFLDDSSEVANIFDRLLRGSQVLPAPASHSSKAPAGPLTWLVAVVTDGHPYTSCLLAG